MTKDNTTKKIERRYRRHKRVKKAIEGFSKRPRLYVYRSNNHIYAQIIDDQKNITLVQASDRDSEVKKKNDNTKSKTAYMVGELIAKRCIDKNINEVVFDRGGFMYKGRVKSLAEGARKGGLKI